MIKLSRKRNLQIDLLKNTKGQGLGLFIFFMLILVFIVIPLFSAIVEKQLTQLKISDIGESIELSSIATYDSLVSSSLSDTIVSIDSIEATNTFKKYLADNLNINSDLTPKPSGIIAGTVVVNSFQIYVSSFPRTCPNGKLLTKPSIHTFITVPVTPTLYKYSILQVLGEDKKNLKFHYDTEIVLDK